MLQGVGELTTPSQSIVVTIGNQELDITIPEGFDPLNFVNSNIVKVTSPAIIHLFIQPTIIFPIQSFVY